MRAKIARAIMKVSENCFSAALVTARRKTRPPFTRQTPPYKPVVRPRFPVGSGNRIFNYRKAVFIGNKAEYS